MATLIYTHGFLGILLIVTNFSMDSGWNKKGTPGQLCNCFDYLRVAQIHVYSDLMVMSMNSVKYTKYPMLNVFIRFLILLRLNLEIPVISITCTTFFCKFSSKESISLKNENRFNGKQLRFYPLFNTIQVIFFDYSE